MPGCASIKEAARGFTGVSTKVLEDGRKDAIVETIPMGYDACFTKVMESLKSHGAYVYAGDAKRHMLAFYVSDQDTTPVGIFFKELDAQSTQWEISSPSSYAKELMARILSKAFNPEENDGKDVYERE